MHYSGVFDELRAIRICREGGGRRENGPGNRTFHAKSTTMKTACLTFNPIQENTYVVWDDTLECVVVDAGNSTERENAALRNFIEQHGLKPVAAVNTH